MRFLFLFWAIKCVVVYNTAVIPNFRTLKEPDFMRTSQFSCATKVILRTPCLCYSICLCRLSIGKPHLFCLYTANYCLLWFSLFLCVSVSPYLPSFVFCICKFLFLWSKALKYMYYLNLVNVQVKEEILLINIIIKMHLYINKELCGKDFLTRYIFHL